MKQMKKVLSLLLCFAMLCSMALFLAPQASADGSSEHWVAAWHGSVLNAKEDSQAAKAISSISSLASNGRGTFRIQVPTQLGGKDFRMTLTNYYGTGSLSIDKVTIGLQGSEGLSGQASGTTVSAKTSDGKSSFSIATKATQDVFFSFPNAIPEGSSLIINIYCTSAKNVRDFALTGGSAWFQSGDVTNDLNLSLIGNAANLVSINNGEGDYNLLPLLQEIDVMASADTYTTVFIGDSTITNSIPNMLQDNLQRNGIHNVSVVSSAIKGNELLQDGAGKLQGPLEGAALTTRFQMDALEVAGVQKIFVKIGANDILHPLLPDLKEWFNGSNTRPDGYVPTAEQIIGGYQNLIDQVNAYNAANGTNIQLYFTDINPLLGYTRANSLTWTADMATAANNIRLTVNQWLADNQSQYAGYAPFSNAVGTDVVIDGVTFQKGKIAEAYTTDYAHPSPVGMQLEADLIPLSWFKAADATPAANEASVKGLWVATNKAPTNGLWMIASNSGSKVKDTAGQQTAVHLLATDTSFNDEIDTSDYPGSRTGGYYGNAYNELGDVASTIQRGTAAAPYVAAKNVDQSIAVWRRYGYGTRIYWQDSYYSRFLSFYYPLPPLRGTVSEFDAGLRDGLPSHSFADSGSRAWYTEGNTSSDRWSSDPWELSMHLGAAGSVAGDKYLAWGDMLSSANSRYATPGYHFRVYNTDGSVGYKGGENGNGTITYLSSVDSVHTTLTAAETEKRFSNGAAGTVVPFDFILTDDLLNVGTTKANAVVKNTTAFTTDGSTNVQSLLYTGYTYGQNQTLTCTSDKEDVAYFENGVVKLGGGFGTANLTWTFSWEELDGQQYSMTLTTVVINEGGQFTLVHGSNGETETLDVSTNFDLTETVAEGYLYGGAFLDAAYTTPVTYSGLENALCFTPEAGKAYYIREVPNTYLQPKSLSLSKHKDATTVDVIGFYLMSVVDGLNYREAGFEATANGQPIVLRSVEEADVTLGGSAYANLYVRFTNGTEWNLTANSETFGNLSGYLTCLEVPKEYWAEAGTEITFTPYWITMDGVKVTGTATRTCRYEGIGPDTDPKYSKIGKIADDAQHISRAEAVEAAQAAMLTLLDTCSIIAEPDTPVEPETVTVTVVDNGDVREQTFERGDLTGKLEYTGADGMRFAGWFADEACTEPAQLSDVQADMTVYAKYVSDAYLQMKYVEQRWLSSRELQLMSALDSEDYAQTGFVINGVEIPAASVSSRYGIYTARFLFSSVSRNAKLAVLKYDVSGLRRGETLEITPYWVTLDGTTVYGTTRTLTCGTFGWY
jgi:lysophospholipase L1-like esterase